MILKKISIYLGSNWTKQLKMERKNDKNRNLKNIVIEYEVMSRKGTVGFLKETVFLDIIEYYRSTVSVNKALIAVDDALTQYPSSSDFYFLKANLLLDIDRKQDAIDCLERARIFAPGDMDIKILLMSLINEQNASNDEKNGSITSKLFDNRGLFDTDHIEAKLSQMEQKIFLFEEELTMNPRNENALAQLLQCIDFTKDYERGARIFNDVIDRHPFSSSAWFNLGYVYQEMKNDAWALEAYEYAFLIDKEFTAAYECYADLHIQKGNYKKALSAFEDLLSTNIKPNAGLLTQIGYCYELKDDLEFAQAFYVKAFDLDDKYDVSYFRLAECLMKQGRVKQAIGSYMTAIELNANDFDYYLGIADAFLAFGDQDRAINYLDDAVASAPDESFVWIKFIAVLLELDKNAEAMETCIEALDYSSDILLKYAYAVCQFRIGNHQEGMVRLVECLSDDVDAHEIIFTLAPELEENARVIEILEMYLV